MTELIKITENNGKKIVSARELYAFLTDNAENVTRWMTSNIANNVFAIENVDYQRIMQRAYNGRSIDDYAITIDFAKELCMMSQCEKGKQARQYFIEMEKVAKNGMVKLPDFNNPAIAARAWADQYERRELAEKKVFELEPKAEVFDRISNADNLLPMNSAAKSLGTTRPKLFKLLRERNILMGNNLPYQRYIDSGMFKVKIKPIEMGHSGTIDYPQTFVTAKGLTWLGKGIINLEKQADK